MNFDPLCWFALLLAAVPDSLNIPLTMLLVFGSAKLLAELFEKFHQPGIVGEILAGILLGPSILNWLQPTDFLTALADLGVMFLLFRVGLEVKSSARMKVGAPAALAATLGVIVPFILGYGIITLWGGPTVEALFVGAAMVATSVGITAQVLSSKGVLRHTASQLILAAAVIDDILGLLILALVSSMAKGQVNVLELLLTSILAIGFTVLVAKWGTQTMGRFVPGIEKRLRSGEVQFNVAMVLLFALSLLAMRAGVAAIIGAFLAGMALSETVNHRVHDLAHGVTELLVPFFLVGIGLHFDLAAFSDSSTIVLALVILAAAIVSKLVGCGLGALSLGWPNAIRVGVGMIPRGEVGMVVAQIGLGLGVIPKPVYGVVVFMAILTTMLAPPLLNIAYRGVQPVAPAEEFRLG
ncbi:MAG: cation:proton antiporter [Bryobacteraceae bacterium]|nr:cation:proton antiporter [Bryobacteraceae bacterium]